MSHFDAGSKGAGGFSPPTLRPGYTNYRSPFGPQYKIKPNFHGITASRLGKFATTMALFGGVAGFAALFFASEVPKVRNDVLVNIPIIGEYWRRETPPEDDPF